MKAVIFSDEFFIPEVFERAIQPISFWRRVHRVYFNVGWPRVSLSQSERLREYIPYPREALREMQDAEILITQMGLVDETLLAHASRLRAVGCLRSGPVNVDEEALARRGIPLFSAPERSVEAVAEFTIGLFITARRGMLQACMKAKMGIWSQSAYFTYECAPPSLSETVIGLIGFGRIARRVAELLAPFRVRSVLAYDPYVEQDIMARYGVHKVTLDDLLQSSDIVSLHARSPEPRVKILGEREFLLMKQGSILVNTARGDLVDEEALYRALKRGIPAFACIDTCCCEPWESCPQLAELENVLLTPHIAGACRSTVEIGARVVAESIAAYFEKEGTFE